MTDLFDRVLLPVADPDDAAATCRAVEPYATGEIVALHVIEKAGGAPDKASVEQREEYAAEIFDVVRDRLGDDVRTELRFDSDVTDAIFATADDVDATSIVVTPRSGSRIVRLLTGDVALKLVTETDRPVVVLPDPENDDDGGD